MKIFVSHSNSFDFKSELYEPIKNSSLITNHEVFLPHDEGRNENNKEQIKNSDLFVAEVSFPSTGSGIEIGWADVFNVPIWCIYKESEKPSSSAKYVAQKMLAYKDSEDLVRVLEEELQSA